MPRSKFNPLSVLARVSLLLGAGLGLAACGGGGGGGGGGTSGACEEFDCQGMLENLADNVMFPAYQDFATEASTLATEVSDYCTALDGQGDAAAAQGDARAAFESTMSAWQRVEVMNVGPLNESSRRDPIYSWPDFVNACGVDQEVISADQAGGDYDITTRNPARRGLDALGYVLFQEPIEAQCPANITGFGGDGYWTNLSAERKAEARCTYAEHAANDLSRLADELVSLWDGDSGFRAELADPSLGNRYDGIPEAVNAVSDALFYVEKKTKDTKLAVPLGLKSNSCNGDPCPADVESPYSNLSKANIHDNLVAFQAMYTGDAPGASTSGALGFDDFLNAAGDDNVASMMRTDIGESIQAVENINASLGDAVANNVSQVEEAHGELKQVTDRLKNDFLNVLNLQIPGSAAGDGD